MLHNENEKSIGCISNANETEYPNQDAKECSMTTNGCKEKEKRNENINLCINYQNANGLRTKVQKFKNGISLNGFPIYVVTETGLNDSFYDSELFTNEFVVYRCDRSKATSVKSQKGGAMIGVHTSIESELVLNCDSLGIEQLWVKVKCHKKWLYICALYIPPKSQLCLYDAHMNSIVSRQEDMNIDDSCVVMGDFNLPNLKWCFDRSENDEADEHFLVPVNVTSEVEISVVDSMMSVGLVQVNSVNNDNHRLLDLVFTNDWNNVC